MALLTRELAVLDCVAQWLPNAGAGDHRWNLESPAFAGSLEEIRSARR